MPTTMNKGGDGAEASEDLSVSLVGTRVGKYDIIRIVGKGGMGCVYEALNTTIQKRVAMKCIDHQLAKNAEAYERFHREALAASAIESPHIIQIFDAGHTDDGVPYIVMELLRGMDLGGYLNRAGRLDLNDALHVTIHVLKGLHHAHTAGIIHRDLKPDNVFLVDRDDEAVFVKLLDFGVSKIARLTDVPLETLTRQGTVVGTPFYMSPEQAQAFPDVDSRTDIYSAGALLFECLSGRTPHLGKSYEQVIVNICMKDADDIRTHNPSVPASISAVIAKALSREREDRYENARQMLDALVDAAPESFRHGTPSTKLRAVSLGDVGETLAHTPLVISPAPESKVPSGLADTINLDDSGDVRDALGESGVNPKVERPATLPSDRGEESETKAAQKEREPLGEQPARSVSAPVVVAPDAPRRWALAAAPGVALLLGLVLFIQFGTGDADQDAATDPAAKPANVAAEPPPVSAPRFEEEQPMPAAAVASASVAPAASSSAQVAAPAPADSAQRTLPSKPHPAKTRPSPPVPPRAKPQPAPDPPPPPPAPQQLQPPQLKLQGPE